jgi:fructose-bisphosphate aldolase class II
MASAKTVRQVLADNPSLYDPRKYLGPARETIKETVKNKMREFGSSRKAKA